MNEKRWKYYDGYCIKYQNVSSALAYCWHVVFDVDPASNQCLTSSSCQLHFLAHSWRLMAIATEGCHVMPLQWKHDPCNLIFYLITTLFLDLRRSYIYDVVPAGNKRYISKTWSECIFKHRTDKFECLKFSIFYYSPIILLCCALYFESYISLKQPFCLQTS